MPNRRPLSLVVSAVLFTCALVFLQGCYLCPYDAEYFYGVDSNYSFKLGDDVRAKTWVTLGRYTFQQRTHFFNGILIMDAIVNMDRQRAFNQKVRARLYDPNHQLRATWKAKSKYKANGELAKQVRRNFEWLFLPGYYVVIDAWFSRKLLADTLFLIHFGYDQSQALE